MSRSDDTTRPNSLMNLGGQQPTFLVFSFSQSSPVPLPPPISVTSTSTCLHPSPSPPVCGVAPSTLYQLWSLFFFGFRFRKSTFNGISATPSTSLNRQSVLPLFCYKLSPPLI